MASRTEIKPGETIPSVTKSITEESILGFESTGILDRENIHNNPELAAKRLGTTYTLASGRMSLTFAAESLRKFFGPEVFNHTGTVNLKFLRPVKAGDTVTARVTVKDVDIQTKRITVDTVCTVGDTVVIDGEAQLIVDRRPEVAVAPRGEASVKAGANGSGRRLGATR